MLSKWKAKINHINRCRRSIWQNANFIQLNAEFQRIARRDKKTFLSEQYIEIEENNKMGKIRDLFKKIRDTKTTFQAKMDTIKTEMVRT